MPLTASEVRFLGPYLAEATAPPFTGPYTLALRAAGLVYHDIAWLTEAYTFADPPRLEWVDSPDGPREELKIGRASGDPPVFPWPDADTARERDHLAGGEVAHLRAVRASRPAAETPDRTGA